MKFAIAVYLSLLLSLAASAEPPILPDPRLTPGAALDVTVADIAVPGYTKKVRNVPIEVKREVYAEYGILSHAPREFEVDHLIPLELGGSNSKKNLWPESFITEPWNAYVKDVLENRLHVLVCSGQLDLKAAQDAIATNWIEAYRKYVGPEPGRSKRPAPTELTEHAPPTSTAGATQVWVNTKSGVYWRSGTSYYGKTKQGEYMSESEAIAHGYHAPGGH